MKSYAGIGSRETPADILTLMMAFAAVAADKGLILRSGGADGADTAFERGCTYRNGRKEIYLPWKDFNGNKSRYWPPSSEAEQMAARYHPNWAACSQGARKLHARNCHQMLGLGLNEPVNFVICWTPGASGSGGTGQALRIARSLNIPIFDLGNPAMVAFIESELASV